MFERWKTVYAVLVAAGIVLFGLAAVPDGGKLAWVATTGWFGMMFCVLAIIVFSITLAIRAATRQSSR